MKKLMIGLFALVLCLGLTSCGGPDLKSIVEKAKTEGANWSVDEWKAQIKNVMEAVSPMMKEAKEFAEKIEKEKDPEKMKALMEEGKKFEEKYKDIEPLMDEFEKVVQESENGKKVMEDEAFMKETLKEFGLEGFDF